MRGHLSECELFHNIYLIKIYTQETRRLSSNQIAKEQFTFPEITNLQFLCSSLTLEIQRKTVELHYMSVVNLISCTFTQSKKNSSHCLFIPISLNLKAERNLGRTLFSPTQDWLQAPPTFTKLQSVHSIAREQYALYVELKTYIPVNCIHFFNNQKQKSEETLKVNIAQQLTFPHSP